MFPGFDGDLRISFPKYLDAVAYFEKYADPIEYDEYFYDYLTDVLFGWSFQEAMNDVYPNLAFEMDLDSSNIYDSMDVEKCFHVARQNNQLQKSADFDEWESENDRWYGKRIDDDLYYDPDNPEYNDELDDDDIW